MHYLTFKLPCLYASLWLHGLQKNKNKQKNAKITSEIDHNKSCHEEIAKCILLLALHTKARILCLDSLQSIVA
jgi:hypothetical protein